MRLVHQPKHDIGVGFEMKREFAPQIRKGRIGCLRASDQCAEAVAVIVRLDFDLQALAGWRRSPRRPAARALRRRVVLARSAGRVPTGTVAEPRSCPWRRSNRSRCVWDRYSRCQTRQARSPNSAPARFTPRRRELAIRPSAGLSIGVAKLSFHQLVVLAPDCEMWRRGARLDEGRNIAADARKRPPLQSGERYNAT